MSVLLGAKGFKMNECKGGDKGNDRWESLGYSLPICQACALSKKWWLSLGLFPGKLGVFAPLLVCSSTFQMAISGKDASPI